jgi:hypothetical protein
MCCRIQCAIAIITAEAALVPALWYGHFTSILHISVTVSQSQKIKSNNTVKYLLSFWKQKYTIQNLTKLPSANITREGTEIYLRNT